MQPSPRLADDSRKVPVTCRFRLLGVALVAAVLAAACGGDGSTGERSRSGGAPRDDLIVQVASYDLSVRGRSRFLVGLLTPEQLFVSGGSVDMRFTYLGTEDDPVSEEGPTARGRFLPVPGEEDHVHAGEPAAGPASEGRGVYAAQVAFDRAGTWEVEVTAPVKGDSATATAAFQVREEPQVPAVGDRAPRTENLTVDSADAPREAIDSRAHDGGKIPDPELHRMTIAETIERREPAVVVFATPVYCMSRFCGPITDMIQQLARRYDDRANFIHVEIWRDFQNQVVNKAAAEWLLRGGLTEPWVFLIDGNGRIARRWDNVATKQEVEAVLRELPRR